MATIEPGLSEGPVSEWREVCGFSGPATGGLLSLSPVNWLRWTLRLSSQPSRPGTLGHVRSKRGGLL